MSGMESYSKYLQGTKIREKYNTFVSCRREYLLVRLGSLEPVLLLGNLDYGGW